MRVFVFCFLGLISSKANNQGLYKDEDLVQILNQVITVMKFYKESLFFAELNFCYRPNCEGLGWLNCVIFRVNVSWDRKWPVNSWSNRKLFKINVIIIFAPGWVQKSISTQLVLQGAAGIAVFQITSVFPVLPGFTTHRHRGHDQVQLFVNKAISGFW